VRKRLALAIALAVLAASVAWAASASRVAKPVILVETPGSCVAPTDVMRRNHMRFLMHQRDRTVHEGIRTKQHSLAGCVECHASSKTGSVLGEDGFCQSCHAYAGVHLDCFQCHASKPGTVARRAGR
jgi:cytochrome c553